MLRDVCIIYMYIHVYTCIYIPVTGKLVPEITVLGIGPGNNGPRTKIFAGSPGPVLFEKNGPP